MLCRDPNEPGDLPTPQGLNRENSTRAEDWRNLLEPAARSLREACSPPWTVAGAPVHRLYGIEDPAMRRDRERLDLRAVHRAPRTGSRVERARGFDKVDLVSRRAGSWINLVVQTAKRIDRHAKAPMHRSAEVAHVPRNHRLCAHLR